MAPPSGLLTRAWTGDATKRTVDLGLDAWRHQTACRPGLGRVTPPSVLLTEARTGSATTRSTMVIRRAIANSSRPLAGRRSINNTTGEPYLCTVVWIIRQHNFAPFHNKPERRRTAPRLASPRAVPYCDASRLASTSQRSDKFQDGSAVAAAAAAAVAGAIGRDRPASV